MHVQLQYLFQKHIFTFKPQAICKEIVCCCPCHVYNRNYFTTFNMIKIHFVSGRHVGCREFVIQRGGEKRNALR